MAIHGNNVTRRLRKLDARLRGTYLKLLDGVTKQPDETKKQEAKKERTLGVFIESDASGVQRDRLKQLGVDKHVVMGDRITAHVSLEQLEQLVDESWVAYIYGGSPMSPA